MVKTPSVFKVPTLRPRKPQKRHRLPPSNSESSNFGEVYSVTPPAPVSPCTILGLKPPKKMLKFCTKRLMIQEVDDGSKTEKKTGGSISFGRKFQAPQSATGKGELIMAFERTPEVQRNVLAVKTNSGFRLPTPPPWKMLHSSTPVKSVCFTFPGEKTDQSPAPVFNYDVMNHDDSGEFQPVDTNNNDSPHVNKSFS